MCLYNPLDKFYKSFIGAVPEKTKITFRVKGNFNSVLFILKKDGYDTEIALPMQKIDEYFEIEASFDIGLYFYIFKTDNNQYISLGNDYLGVLSNTPNYFQITAYLKDYNTPNWLKGGVIYQIFPDRFYSSGENIKNIRKDAFLHTDKTDTPIFLPNNKGKVLNNDFFGGDIKGIISKLDYISSLGVNCIYLNPIFKAYSNHRYDTGDYMTIDPLLGCEDDLKELISVANTKNIKIVLDGVFNHTGDDSLYFNKYGNYDSVGAFSGEKSPYYSWYEFTKFPKYNSWWGIETLPQVNENDKSYCDFITGEDGVVAYYAKLGVAGWRLDVVDELPDHFVKNIRTALKNVNNDAVLIGEVWEDASNKIAYDKRREYFLGSELDSVMNYPFKNAILDFVLGGSGIVFTNVIKSIIDHYPKIVLDSLMNLLSTHDTPRLLSSLSNINIFGLSKLDQSKLFIQNNEISYVIKRLKLATLLQYTLPGVPSIYYGDEIGMQGFSDPLNRKFFDWENINSSILDWYKKLGNIRKNFSCLVDGEIEFIYSSDNAVVFTRSNDKDFIIVAINLGDRDIIVNSSESLCDYVNNIVIGEKVIVESKNALLLTSTNFINK